MGMASEQPVTSQTLNAVLVVEDDPVTLENYAELLQRSGIAHRTSSSGSEGLSILDDDPTIDVIVTDLMLPDIDGLGVLNSLRPLLAGRPWIQAIVVTGHPSLETAIQALRLEAVDFLTKPVAPSDLIAAVQRARARAFSMRFRDSKLSRSASAGRSAMDHSQAAKTLAANDSAHPGESPAAPLTPEHLRRIIKARALRSRMFDASLFSDPAWDMLLDLMLAHLSGKKVYVTSLCIAAGVPIATAFRRIEDLASKGLVTKTRDSKDTRRVFVELTEPGIQKMAGYFGAVGLQAGAA
jgi:DNA-binding response OmpR family regulator/DNA-binding MarR family transcriptional regulator